MSNVLSKFYQWETQTPNHLLFQQPLAGRTRIWTYAQAGQEIRKIATALQLQNLPRRSRVAILSKNCAHWMMADLAILMAGHISVPLYPTLSAHSIDQILKHSDPKVIFIGKPDDYKSQKDGIPASIQKISFDENEVATIKYTAAGKAKSKEEVSKSLEETLTSVNKEIENYERLQAIVVMKSDWTIENGLLTPSLKVKRNEVEKIYLLTYPSGYSLNTKVVFA